MLYVQQHPFPSSNGIFYPQKKVTSSHKQHLKENILVSPVIFQLFFQLLFKSWLSYWELLKKKKSSARTMKMTKKIGFFLL